MRRGQITIFLALLLSVVCALLSVIIESARENVMRMQIEAGMDMGMHSIFAEYNREMLSRYDLFYIDSSYGERVSIENTEGHLKEYMEANLVDTGEIGSHSGFNKKGDWFQLSVVETEIDAYLLASDYEGKVLRNQAVNYMSQYAEPGVHNISNIVAEIEGAGIHGGTIAGNRNRVEARISIRTIVDDINSFRSGNVLTLVQAGRAVSHKSVPVNSLASHRALAFGQGQIANKAEVSEEEAEQLFEQYLCCKCSNFRKVRENSALDYETEYLLIGKSSDRENLTGILTKLIQMRERANVNYLFEHSGKKEEAHALAVLILTGLALPELEEPLTDAILFAWGYAEAALDVNCLLVGGRVPAMKTDSDWRLPLKDLLLFRNYMGEGGGSGLSYEEYLHYFLYKSDDVRNRMRCMDVMEADVRLAEGNSSFQIDGCVEYLKATVETVSGFGYQHSITRDFGYEIPLLTGQR
jgi:hypothetical protein